MSAGTNKTSALTDLVQFPDRPEPYLRFAEQAQTPMKAVDLTRRAVTLVGSHALVFVRHAAALAAAGRHADAIPWFQSALRLVPTFLEAQVNLSVSLSQTGRTEEALLAMKRAVLLVPEMADLYANHARLQARHLLAKESLTSLRHCLRLRPDAAMAVAGLGNEFARSGRYAEAIALHRIAATIAPGLSDIYSNLSALLGNTLDREGAIRAARHALKLMPYRVDSHNNLALANEKQGALDVAAHSARTTLSIDPAFADGWDSMAVIGLNLGQFSQAARAARRAIRLQPDRPRFHRVLSLMPSRLVNQTDIQAMAALLANENGMEPRAAADLHFSLAKMYENSGNASLRFVHLLQGNARIRKTFGYQETSQLAWLTLIEKKVTAAYVGARGRGGFPDASPIFIIGMPRSGTSLVEQILASHSNVFGGGELHDFPLALDQSLRLKSERLDVALEALGKADFAAMGRRYCDRVRRLAPEAVHITDKLPSNFRYAGLIHLALPNAKLIHIRRDPVDTCLSCFATLFTEGQEYSYDLFELGKYYRAYRGLMDHWERVLTPTVLLTISYEALVEDFEPNVRRLLEFCELPWEQQCMNFHQTDRAVRTASAIQVRQPLYRSSIGKLRPEYHLLEPLFAGLEGRPIS